MGRIIWIAKGKRTKFREKGIRASFRETIIARIKVTRAEIFRPGYRFILQLQVLMLF